MPFIAYEKAFDFVKTLAVIKVLRRQYSVFMRHRHRIQNSNQEYKYKPEMSSVRGVWGVSGWDGESIDSENEKFGMGATVKGMGCGVME